MNKLISAVFLTIAVGALARVFWLKEFAEERDYSQMFLYLGIMLAAGITFSLLKRGPARKKELARKVVISTPDRVDELPTPDLEARGDALPGWQLRRRSPFAPKRAVKSWIGGVPVAYSGFVWPRDKNDQALHFVAQIDLADLHAEPASGDRPALPDTGAMLVFITERVSSDEAERPSYNLMFLSADEMKHARAIPVPEDLRPLQDLGFWLDVPSFHYHPVDLVPYLDTDHDQIELPPLDGTDWFDTWGLAAFEAQAALTAMENECNQRKWRAEFEERSDKSVPEEERQVPQKKKTAFLTASERPVHEALKAFLERAKTEDQTAPVDSAALNSVLALRSVLAEGMPNNTMMKIRMTPNARNVFSDLVLKYLDRDRGSLVSVPPAYHPFMSDQITAKNHHRLFGLAVPAMTDYPDLRGLDCLLTLDSDALLGTQTEHESGFSIWCDRTEMAKGRFELGRVIWHTNV